MRWKKRILHENAFKNKDSLEKTVKYLGENLIYDIVFIELGCI